MEVMINWFHALDNPAKVRSQETVSGTWQSPFSTCRKQVIDEVDFWRSTEQQCIVTKGLNQIAIEPDC